MANTFKKENHVHVSGEVKWGEESVGVDSPGIIEEWKKGAYALVNIDQVSGDSNVRVHVLKKYIYEPESEHTTKLHV